MQVIIGSDHGGFELKAHLKEFLEEMGAHVDDVGAHSAEASDYPDIAHTLTDLLKTNSDALGLLICGTGIGMSIAANRHRHVRAALCTSVEHAHMSRAHNNANVLCLGGRTTTVTLAEDIIRAFLETPFESGGRHERRVGKL